jgi:hypothetical protein
MPTFDEEDLFKLGGSSKLPDSSEEEEEEFSPEEENEIFKKILPEIAMY